jgi:hypothetical protein
LLRIIDIKYRHREVESLMKFPVLGIRKVTYTRQALRPGTHPRRSSAILKVERLFENQRSALTGKRKVLDSSRPNPVLVFGLILE